MDDGTVGVEDVAEWLGVTPRRVQQLAAEGVIPRDGHGRYTLKAVVQAYCRHMGSIAAGRGDDDLSRERARLAREQANKYERENALATGEIVPKQDVVAGMQAVFAHVRARVLAIPSRAAPLVEGLSAPKIREKLTELVNEACDELRHTRFVPLRASADGVGVQPGGDGGGAGLDAPAVADGERVG